MALYRVLGPRDGCEKISEAVANDGNLRDIFLSPNCFAASEVCNEAALENVIPSPSGPTFSHLLKTSNSTVKRKKSSDQ